MPTQLTITMTTKIETSVFDLLVSKGNEVLKIWQMKLPKCSLHPDGTVPQQGGLRVGKTNNQLCW